VSIGESLAKARRQAGLTVSQVSEQTRIRESIIRDIEQDDFTTCGGDFYARGHIRSVAGVVGVDPTPLISEYDAEHGPLGPLRAAEVFEPSTPIKIRERRSPSLSLKRFKVRRTSPTPHPGHAPSELVQSRLLSRLQSRPARSPQGGTPLEQRTYLGAMMAGVQYMLDFRGSRLARETPPDPGVLIAEAWAEILREIDESLSAVNETEER
jgi:transcriptional regulator with XRE-family HTH domain